MITEVNNTVKLIVIVNPRNDERNRTIKINGMDYVLNVSIDKLTRAYMLDIVNRVKIYGERVIVVINGNVNEPNNSYETIFGFTGSETVKAIIDYSDVAYYDGILVKDKRDIIK